MEARCHHCGQTQTIADSIFGKHERVDLVCAGCGKGFKAINPKLATFHAETTRKTVPTISSEVSVDGNLLSLPENENISLKVLEGNEKGTLYPVTKPRVTIGRTNSDIIIDDRLSSRVHCSLEVSGHAVLLRDLESTNGTFVADRPIKTAALVDGSIFRIGEHSFQLVITPKET